MAASASHLGLARLRRIVSHLGWLPLTLTAIGGLSIVSALEQVAYDGRINLISPFRILLDGYQRISSLVGALVEPTAMMAANWLNQTWHWEITINPVWRAIFILSLAIISCFARVQWLAGLHKDAVWMWLVGGLSSLIASVAVGMSFGTGGWFAQALIASVPLVVVCVIPIVIDNAVGGNLPRPLDLVGFYLFSMIVGLIVIGVPTGAVAALTSLIPYMANVSGILVLMVGTFLVGAFLYAIGGADDSPGNEACGLYIMGAFISALLLLAANYLVLLA